MINLETLEVLGSPSIEAGFRLLKTAYGDNKERYIKRFLEPLKRWLSMNNHKFVKETIKCYEEEFDRFKPYTYTEAFKIEDTSFKASVFSAINVVEMISNLGTERVSTKGIELVNRVWNEKYKCHEDIPITQVYELHRVNGSELGLDRPLYAIKCWCTSTNNEHWLWTLESSCPLKAIANCCVVYKSMIGEIKYIIRQGDVFLFEMKRKVNISEDEETIRLEPDVYFKLLKSQS